MWGLKSRRSRAAERVRTLSISGVLDEQTFWQIVRTEKERADRSGMPVTVVIFTIREDDENEHAMSGWNAAALCSVLRSTARLTDHVGIAGDNELGVLLWGTRELGAYRFVNRLGAKAEQVAGDCRLFVYPTLPDAVSENKDGTLEDVLPDNENSADNGILERISEVEQKLSEALEVETPAARNDDCPDMDESFGFGADSTGDDFHSHGASGAYGGPGGSAAVAERKPATATEHSTSTTPDPTRQRTAREQASAVEEELLRQTKLNVVTEPLENLFLLPHPFWKRCLDVAGAIFGLIVLSPVLLTVAAIIKLTSRGPVLFRQVREGHGGRLFTIYKFRTMRVGADADKAALRAESEQDGPAFKMKDDPRITPIGGFLRRTCLDELPQLWNVLIGDMALVGPRPLDFRESWQIARWGRRRLMVMPGLTCIWQVHGKSRVTFNEWMRMDIRYAQKMSFREDVKLVLATIKQMLLRQASH